MNTMSIASVSMHASMPREDILAFHVTQKYTLKFIWLILSTIRQNGDNALDTLEFCYFCYCVFYKVV